MVVIYPKNYKDRKTKIGEYIAGIKTSKMIKILGLRIQQPKFYKDGRVYWFTEQAKYIKE